MSEPPGVWDVARVNAYGLAQQALINAEARRSALAAAEARRDGADRATAARDVEALLRRVHDVTEEADDVVRFYLAGDGAFLRDVHNMTAADLASLVVDAVLGQEEM